MVSLTKSEKVRLKDILSKSQDKESKKILNKLNNEKRLRYAYGLKEIRFLLKMAYQQRKQVKIRYYSLSSDEVRWRKVSIYQFGPDFIIAYCHLRGEERTFVTSRISQVAILDESYKIPKNWEPDNIVR